jgi:hypothetical protein
MAAVLKTASRGNSARGFESHALRLTPLALGSIVERKRPFMLLRLTGTPVRALYRVVLLETLAPLIAASVTAAAVGLAVAIPVSRALASASHAVPLPDGAYYAALGSGLLIATAIILACLPILSRVTVTDNARSE